MLPGMSELEARVGMARELVAAVLDEATGRLMAGADIWRIHGHFVIGAGELLREVELHAVLASAGDREALSRIGELVKDLERLRAELEEETG
jgi:hypothetical protein